MKNEIGSFLRQARLARSESLRSVAAAVGVSPSLISQVETGKTQPSVLTLYSLTNYLGLSIDDLLAKRAEATSPHESVAPPSSATGHSWPTVQRGADNPSLEMENGVRWERLAVGPGATAEPLLVTYEPGAASSVEGKLMRHNGYEYAYILEGHLTLQLEFERYELGPGDSLQFDSVRPHMYLNHGDVPARGVWYVVGRNPVGESATETSNDRERPHGQMYELNSAVDVLNALGNHG